MFTSALFFYSHEPTRRAILSLNQAWASAYFNFSVCNLQIKLRPEGVIVASDTDGDGVDDHAVSKFDLVGFVVDLTFDVVQRLERVGSGAVSMLTQEYTITNNQAEAIDFILLRQFDLDLLWDAGPGATDDSVGTGTNGLGERCDRFVYQLEDGAPETAVTISSPQGDIYYGAKGGLVPGHNASGNTPFGFGTGLEQWDAFGVPTGWDNIIAGVPDENEIPNIDGESGTTPDPANCSPCDGSIGLRIPVSLAPGAQTTVIMKTTYGARLPGDCVACNEACLQDADVDGDVDTADLATLIACWGPVGQAGASCQCLDADGDGDVDAADLAELLVKWGTCP